MLATATVRSTTRRLVVDHSALRSRPRSMTVTLPYIRALEAHEDSALAQFEARDPDAAAGRGRLGKAY